MHECQSVYSQGACFHGCVLEPGHDGKHKCECNYEWDDEDAEEE